MNERIQSAERLFSEHGSFISSIIRFFVKDEFEREEIYQDLFLFFVRKPVPENVRNLKGFLYCVINDRIKDRRRKQTRYQQNLAKYADSSSPDNEVEAGFLSEVHHKEQSEYVFSLLREHLTRNEATAITLRYKHDYDLRETARRMNIQPKTVSRYVCIGLKKIRDVFQKEEKAQDKEGELG